MAKSTLIKLPTAKNGKAKTAPGLSREQLELMDRRNALLGMIMGGQQDRNPTIYMQRRELAGIEQQLISPTKASPMVKPKPKPKPAAVAPVAAPVAADPMAVAPVAEPVAQVSPVEQQVAAAKTEEQLRLERIEAAKEAEMKRQEELRRRRGTGVLSFVTGGLRGSASPLSQILGV